ncbi:MAG: aminotransferase class I/II-fold pyridoxal phosphate-dependent enzyme [Candidatus Marinimicrobia bacterium]|nr:aminotransferase class I/II-fold pyridoxal phosphate-dependent enzyme [Candidatus Neomarinimicrobiota bacterium]
MNLQSLFAERLGGPAFGTTNAVYKFGKIKQAKAAARQARPEVEMLDFGVGEPDQMAPAVIREALQREVDCAENRGYADNGIPEFKQAAAEYLRLFFGVSALNPETQINHSIGSKPALAMLPLCFVNPGDVVLSTVPGYPVMATHARYLGARVVELPLLARNGFYPDLDAIDPQEADRAKLFYVNYPNNPTGAAADEAFFDRLIAFAKRHNILIVQDAAYATLVYDRPGLSILGRPGGADVALELHSMSKSYNMTGWRLGFVAGSAPAVAAFAHVKDNSDSGQFKAIQRAACAGIADRALADGIRAHYEQRLRKLVSVLKRAGFAARMPGGTFYLYVPAPVAAGDQAFANAEAASQFLIREHSISTVPWDDAGAFLRFSATFESAGATDDDRVLAELERRLAAARLCF